MNYWSRFRYLKGSVFVVTYGRSGSTLIQSVIQSIHGAHIRGENYGALFPLEASVKRIEKSQTDWGQKSLGPNRPWYGAHYMDVEGYRNGAIAAYVDNVLRPPSDVRWIGFKEIRFYQLGDGFRGHMAFLRASFPNAQFVFNSRHPASVAKSGWFKSKGNDFVEAMVNDQDQRYAAYAKENSDHSVHLRYEDFAGNPQGFRPLFELLDEPFDVTRLREILDIRLTH